jgi:hypothetical protein
MDVLCHLLAAQNYFYLTDKTEKPETLSSTEYLGRNLGWFWEQITVISNLNAL